MTIKPPTAVGRWGGKIYGYFMSARKKCIGVRANDTAPRDDDAANGDGDDGDDDDDARGWVFRTHRPTGPRRRRRQRDDDDDDARARG